MTMFIITRLDRCERDVEDSLDARGPFSNRAEAAAIAKWAEENEEEIEMASRYVYRDDDCYSVVYHIHIL